MAAESTWGREATLEEALSLDAQEIRITAPVGAGKTEFIVRKAMQVVQKGGNPAAILCVVSSPTAAYRLRQRLQRASDALIDCVVQTPLQMCVGLLESQEAREYTGRGSRLLGGAEYNMLLEDMKVVAPDAAALRALLAKVFKGLGTLAPREEWGLDAAESRLYDALLDYLRFQGALLREEASFLAASYLQVHESAQGSYEVVFIDDAHNVSTATMGVCRLLASKLFVACGNPNQAQGGFDRYASTAAFETFGKVAECLQFAGCTQPAAIAGFCDALCANEAMDSGIQACIQSDELPNKQALTCIKWHEPDDEFRGVAQLVRTLMKEREGTNPGDIFILVPNRAWAHALSNRLEARRVSSMVMMDGDPVVGDPRTENTGTLDAYCRLALAADIQDIPAWRLWCGLGNKTCRAQTWAAFKVWAQEQGLSAIDALEALSNANEDVFEGAHELQERYKAGLAAVGDLATKRGFALLKLLAAAPGGKQLTTLLEPIEGDEDAVELHRRLVEISLEPYFIPNPHQVAIGSYKLIQGLDPRHIIACGLVEGYIPPLFHAKLIEGAPATTARLNAERRGFYNAIGKARETLVLSTVQRAEADLAAKMRMDVRRLRHEHGRNMAVLARSCFIDEAGDAAPSSVSGEQFLAEEE